MIPREESSDCPINADDKTVLSNSPSLDTYDDTKNSGKSSTSVASSTNLHSQRKDHDALNSSSSNRSTKSEAVSHQYYPKANLDSSSTKSERLYHDHEFNRNRIVHRTSSRDGDNTKSATVVSGMYSCKMSELYNPRYYGGDGHNFFTPQQYQHFVPTAMIPAPGFRAIPSASSLYANSYSISRTMPWHFSYNYPDDNMNPYNRRRRRNNSVQRYSVWCYTLCRAFILTTAVILVVASWFVTNSADPVEGRKLFYEIVHNPVVQNVEESVLKEINSLLHPSHLRNNTAIITPTSSVVVTITNSSNNQIDQSIGNQRLNIEKADPFSERLHDNNHGALKGFTGEKKKESMQQLDTTQIQHSDDINDNNNLNEQRDSMEINKRDGDTQVDHTEHKYEEQQSDFENEGIHSFEGRSSVISDSRSEDHDVSDPKKDVDRHSDYMGRFEAPYIPQSVLNGGMHGYVSQSNEKGISNLAIASTASENSFAIVHNDLNPIDIKDEIIQDPVIVVRDATVSRLGETSSLVSRIKEADTTFHHDNTKVDSLSYSSALSSGGLYPTMMKVHHNDEVDDQKHNTLLSHLDQGDKHHDSVMTTNKFGESVPQKEVSDLSKLTKTYHHDHFDSFHDQLHSARSLVQHRVPSQGN